jgi:Ca2+-binding RTX toxin-like protein
VIIGLNGNDNLTGGSGNDTLDGGLGNDIMAGGLGNDTYVVDSVGDRVIEAANSGIDTVLTSLASYTLGANVENLTFTGAGNFTGIGNNLTNVITGGAGNDTLTDGTNAPGAGGDTLIGGAGNDTYNVSNVGDVIVENAGGGTDTVRTTLGSYTLGANLENLTFTGTGSFTGTGNSQANVITGGAGNDILDGGLNTSGADTLVGGAGDDTYIVRNAGDVVTETANGGTDTVLAVINSYTLGINVENLTFIGVGAFTGTGNAGNNVIKGGAGNDTLNGGAGNDTLIGGAGADVLTGGAGSDTFILAKGDANNDLITDFTRGLTPDQILFTGYATGAALAKVQGGTGLPQTLYAVQEGGVTKDQFSLVGDITLAATDYKFV